jgi:hypothetical protein
MRRGTGKAWGLVVSCHAKKPAGKTSAAGGGFGAARAPSTQKKSCPCGSRLLYKQCCQPYHDKKALPPTPEALMRSRYSAYSLNIVDYIVETTHPENPLLKKDDGVSLRKDAARYVACGGYLECVCVSVCVSVCVFLSFLSFLSLSIYLSIYLTPSPTATIL